MLLERQEGKLFAVDIRSREPKTLTPNKDKTFNPFLSPPDILQLSIASYIWSPDSKNIIAQNKQGWWLLFTDGSSPKAIFENISKIITGILRDEGQGHAFSPDGNSVFLEVFDPAKSAKGLLKADLRNGKVEAVSEKIPNYGSIFDILKQNGRELLLYSLSEKEIDNLWIADFSFTNPMRLTDLNPSMKEIPRGKKMLISYRNMNGQELKGALLLPPDYKEGQKYPLVAYVYAGSMVTTLERAFPMSFSAVSSIPQLLSKCDYVVLQPSIPLSPEGQKGSPLQDIPKSVVPAVNAVIDLGIADPERVGVVGQSHGGYTVNVLITQTPIFKAAVALAGLSDLISNYGVFDARWRYSLGGSAHFSSWSEGGQGRMGVPPWEDRMQWIENSPIFYLNKVKTPLLLLHGDLDFVSIQQAEEMFSGLKRLEKEAELVRYFGEGHVLSKPANIRDSWHRIVSWFDTYLK